MNQDEFNSVSEALAIAIYKIEAAEVMVPTEEASAIIEKAREKDTNAWLLRKWQARTAIIALEHLGYKIEKQSNSHVFFSKKKDDAEIELHNLRSRLRCFPFSLSKMWTGDEIKRWVNSVLEK